MQDLTGRTFGPYVIVEPLGEGGMASVYKAYQSSVERYVAVKVLPQQYAGDPQFTTRFRREAKMLAGLQHPHILPVYDFGQEEGFSYMVMPLVAGGTLANYMGAATMTFDEVVRVTRQIADALAYAHGHDLIHRDVKPSNVLMDEAQNCLLSDFGIARMIQGSIMLTTTNTILGTPAYMSPEQGRGDVVDARTDIYSLGVILFEMVTGRVPFRAETPVAVLVKHAMDPLPIPRSLNPKIPPELEKVVLKALAKEPENRFRTASDLSAALGRLNLKPEQRKTLAPPPVPPSAPADALQAKPLASRAASQVVGQKPVTNLAASKSRKLGLAIGSGLIAIAVIGAVTVAGILNLNLDRAGGAAAMPATSLPPTVTAVPPTEAATRGVGSLQVNTEVAKPTSTLAPLPTSTATAVPSNTPTAAPTSTPEPPTATPRPAATATPRPPALSAPQLLAPAQGVVIPFGVVPVFSWTSAGTLTGNQYYRVSVEHGKGFDIRCTQRTSISARDYVVTLPPQGKPFEWTVSVVQVNGAVPDGADCSGNQVVAPAMVGQFTVSGGSTGGSSGGGSAPPPTFTPRP